MKKKNFVSMLMGTIGGILFAIGMCMCLLPEWDALKPGVVFACVGMVVLLAMLIVRRKMEGKPAIKLNGKTFGATVFGIVGTLVFGVGFCMTIIWEGLMIYGILIGVVGILMLMCLIPICKGLE